MHLRPGRFGRSTKCRQTVAGDAFATDPSFLLRLVEPIHNAFPLVSPTVLDHAMNEHGIDIIGVEDFAMMINHLQDILRLAGDLGLNEQFFARQSFDRTAQPLEGPIGLRAVKIGNTLIIGVADQAVKTLTAEVKLDLTAITAGSHAQATELDPGLA